MTDATTTEWRHTTAAIAGSHFEVHGCNCDGETTKRRGKPVVCGHKHRTINGARRCHASMMNLRPGNCKTYMIAEIVKLKEGWRL